MLINDYHPNHKGTQPIRVLQFNLTERLENTHPDFANQTRQLIDSLGFNPGIVYHCNELPIQATVDDHKGQTPYIKGGKIVHIHETFLSYVWCVTYALVTLYEEAVAKPSENQHAGRNVHTADVQLIKDAESLISYAWKLINLYEPWNKNLPNPELYDSVNSTWIHKINGIYLYAMNFILVHEFIHAQEQHGVKSAVALQQGTELEEYNALRRDFEREADLLAIRALRQGHIEYTGADEPASNRVSSELGNLVGFCSLLFFSRSVNTSIQHPSIAERIDLFMQEVKPAPESNLWGTACVAFRLWAAKHGLQYRFPDSIDGYQELYEQMRDAAKQLP